MNLISNIWQYIFWKHMGNTKKRKQIGQKVVQKLFADSAGYCQNPNCLRNLFEDSKNIIHVAEMAHIFSASNNGPRAKIELTEQERGEYENLILLCSNCHTIIDKAEKDYPDKLIEQWKINHKLKIDNLFGAVEYISRKEARIAIEPILSENRTIFEIYAPIAGKWFSPESDCVEIWYAKIKSYILPNNRKILAILDANRKYLIEKEANVLEVYRQHIDDFEARHIGGGRFGGIEFPAELSNILKD